MVKRRNLVPDPRRALADKLARLDQARQAQATVPSGVKDLGEDGDVVWPSTDPAGYPVQKSVKRFAVDLDDTTERQRDLEETLQTAREDLEAAAGRLDDAEDDLDELDARVDVTARQVTRGPVPPAEAPLGAQWLTPDGYLYVRIPCEEVPDAA